VNFSAGQRPSSYKSRAVNIANAAIGLKDALDAKRFLFFSGLIVIVWTRLCEVWSRKPYVLVV